MEKKKELWQKYMEDAVLCFRNAREELRQLPIDDGFYVDRKHLRRAAGVCWLAMIDAAKGFLVEQGVPPEKLKSTDACASLLAGHRELDGKLMQHFEAARRLVHIETYYEGLNKIDSVKSGFGSAKLVIEKLTRQRL